MKNISQLRLNEGQNLFLLSLVGFLLAAGLLAATFFIKGEPTSGFRSVELGLAELSPSGESGGYAVPASGGSVTGCTIDINPNPAAPNQAVTASWTATFQSDHALNSSDHPTLAFLRAEAASSDNTDPDGDDNGSNPQPHHPTRTIRIWRCDTGTNCIAGQGAGWTQLADQQVPFGTTSGTISMGSASATEGNYLYHMRLYYNSNQGGGQGWTPPSEVLCTDILNVDTPLPPPPPSNVDLWVAKIGTDLWRSSYVIRPTEEVKLWWRSLNADYCQALNPTHNFVAGAASGTDSSVDEPPVDGQYDYRVACYRNDGVEVGRDSVFVIKRDLSSTSTPPVIDATDIFVPRGQPTNIFWNTNGNMPDDCEIHGPGLDLTPTPSGTGNRNVTIYNESTYTIRCPGGEDSVDVHVLPVIQET